MARILIVYTTIEGQTERIARHMAQTLRERGDQVELCRAADAKSGLPCETFDGAIVGASIHYGHHPGFLRRLLIRNRQRLASRPSAFFSVSLSGGGPGARPKTAQRYLDDFLRQVRWQPDRSACFGGALQFSKYGFVKRRLMVMIVGMAGGDTDTTRDYEYTDWQAVARFAGDFSAFVAGAAK